MQAPGCHERKWPGAVRDVLDEARRAEVETDTTSLEGRQEEMKKGKLDIPTDWPRPWTELGEGEWVFAGIKVLAWKRYKRRAKFTIYGFSRSHYMRVWYGRKVVHFSLMFKRVKKETENGR